MVNITIGKQYLVIFYATIVDSAFVRFYCLFEKKKSWTKPKRKIFIFGLCSFHNLPETSQVVGKWSTRNNINICEAYSAAIVTMKRGAILC